MHFKVKPHLYNALKVNKNNAVFLKIVQLFGKIIFLFFIGAKVKSI